MIQNGEEYVNEYHTICTKEQKNEYTVYKFSDDNNNQHVIQISATRVKISFLELNMDLELNKNKPHIYKTPEGEFKFYWLLKKIDSTENQVMFSYEMYLNANTETLVGSNTVYLTVNL
ncbi:hypothetical protein [Mycoplasma phocoenae]|uniref:Uncharacterized protein n=1 Tax=Mycoplasma phocoenae TaxID=754517 RepID=A0A858U1B3_9MOLU|nr:hypothetical protein [Mycoplasma phocoenae]QJG66904.1 hypothetical protein HGG69_01010 [Mycoplasma phocoenae]